MLNQLKLITDRTQEDVLLQNSKGTYGAADLNRVESAVKALAELATDLDVRFSPVTKTDWVLSGYPSQNTPTKSQLQRYLNNVKALCDAVEIQYNLPVSMEKLGYREANSIEASLLAAECRVREILSCLRFSGELYAGDDIL